MHRKQKPLSPAARLRRQPVAVRRHGTWLSGLGLWLLSLLSAGAGLAAAEGPTREDVLSRMRGYTGPSATDARADSLHGKVLAGYQGWFTTPGDGSGQGWRHYPRGGEFRPGRCGIEQWPDLTEFDEDEKFATPFRHVDGRVASVFSSHHPKTVQRHFEWMRTYGIDGVFVQRFAVATVPPVDLGHCNAVLANCRESANRTNRCYAVMYDLSGLQDGGTRQVIADWKLLVDNMRIGRDPADTSYLRHRGKPVVAVWGIGFNDGRKYTLAECDELVEFLKRDPVYGGNTVMLGVPAYWRTLERDAVPDQKLLEVIRKADVVSPWSVGRYNSPEAADRHADRTWKPDLDWCRERGIDYLPVVFPGFSWKNLYPESAARPIPRLKGAFLWRQYAAAKRIGSTMIYQAMFDELDEATAIFKVTDNPPVGESRFLDNEGLPSDHYLWLTGMGGKCLRGEIEATPAPPPRTPGG